MDLMDALLMINQIKNTKWQILKININNKNTKSFLDKSIDLVGHPKK